jgi:S1-C subfamily serine protease
MTRLLHILPLLLVLAACDSKSTQNACTCPKDAQITPEAPQDLKASVVRINSTQQDWNAWQPWEKDPPSQRRALAAIIGPQLVLTTAELTANATYLEFESVDGSRFIPAKVITRDYETNLALLGPADSTEGNEFFKNTKPLTITKPPSIGDSLNILQFEANGVALNTLGTLQSVDLASSFLQDQIFLTYMVKASMQSTASSYTLPVLKGNQLAGVLISYDTNDQICNVISTDIIARFLRKAAEDHYQGFPSLGVRIATTEDTSFRQWLHLTEDQGGIYIKSVTKGGSAESAGLKAGDVVLNADGMAIDRRGYYQHPHYGSLSWAHLIRGEKSVGDSLKLDVLRDGKPLQIVAKLSRQDEQDGLVPNNLLDKAPNYLLKGGLLFQELTREGLESYGKEWTSRAPLNLLDAYENPQNYPENIHRVVYLSGVIPTPATIGYESLRNLIVSKVNGKDVSDMKSLIESFNGNLNELHSIEFKDEHRIVYLDDMLCRAVDAKILEQGISRLSHVE